MATFVLMPPRACLDAAVADLLGRVAPGLPVPANAWEVVAGPLAVAARWPADTYLIPQDDLPDGDSVTTALVDGFGAEPGDRVVQVGGANGSLPRVRGWVVSPSDVSAGDAA